MNLRLQDLINFIKQKKNNKKSNKKYLLEPDLSSTLFFYTILVFYTPCTDCCRFCIPFII